MKKLPKFLLIFIALILLVTAGHVFYLTTLAAKEKYPEDSYLAAEKNKSALIIVAHDDDMVTSAGTMCMLSEHGWKIREMCFYQQGGLYNHKDSLRNPVRKRSLQEAAVIQGFEDIDPIDFNFRNDMETEKPYMPMPYDSFSVNYREDSLLQIIGKYIRTHKPSVLFTLDDVTGGYGHPDHVMMSRLVIRYCKEHKFDTGFSVQKIYQAVFPPSQSERIMKNMPAYRQAKKTYHTAGMPAPDVQVGFYKYAKQKKECMTAYSTEQNSLRKLWPYYHWYPYWLYFRIFDRDFYRVLDVQKL